MMSNSIETNIGERVKLLRERQLLTQNELSQKSGVPLPTLKDIERGVSKLPRGKTIRALAKALKVTAPYLRYGE